MKFNPYCLSITRRSLSFAPFSVCLWSASNGRNFSWAVLPSEEEAKSNDSTNASSKVIVYSVFEENPTSLLKEAPSLFSERRRARFTSVRLLRSGYSHQSQNYARRLAQSAVPAPLIYARRVVASLFRQGRRAQRENAVRGISQPTKARGSSTTARQRRN
jgi:hypothetical protein